MKKFLNFLKVEKGQESQYIVPESAWVDDLITAKYSFKKNITQHIYIYIYYTSSRLPHHHDHHCPWLSVTRRKRILMYGSGIPEATNGGLGPTLRRRRRRRKGWESEALSSGEKKRRPLVNMRKWQRTLIRVFPFHFWMGLFVENFVYFVGLLLLLYGPRLFLWLMSYTK